MTRDEALIIQINQRQCICKTETGKYRNQLVYIRQLTFPQDEKQFARVSSTLDASISGWGDKTKITGDIHSEWVGIEYLEAIA